MIGQQTACPTSGEGDAQATSVQRLAFTEHYTFSHVINGRPYQIEFDYTSANHLDMRAKLAAAIEAWNTAHPENATDEEKVLASRWSIGQDVDPHTGFRRGVKQGENGYDLVFRRVIDGQTVRIDFTYAGDLNDHDAKMRCAVAAWNERYPENATTAEEVRANGRWSIFVPATREPGTPCIF